jgi:hypothetical protein
MQVCYLRWRSITSFYSITVIKNELMHLLILSLLVFRQILQPQFARYGQIVEVFRRVRTQPMVGRVSIIYWEAVDLYPHYSRLCTINGTFSVTTILQRESSGCLFFTEPESFMPRAALTLLAPKNPLATSLTSASSMGVGHSYQQGRLSAQVFKLCSV